MDPGELRAQALHHDFAGTHQGVHLHGHGVLGRAHQDHRQRQALSHQLGMLAVVQQVAQVLQFVVLPGVLEARRVRLVIGFQLVGRHPHDAFDGVQRDGVEVLAGEHHQCSVHRHGERQADEEAATLTRRRVDAHGAAELFHLGMHHIHADATTGNLGDLVGGGEARFEDELQHLVVGEVGVGVHHAALDGLATHGLELDAGTVVGQGQDDVATLAAEVQADGAGLRLAGIAARLGALDTVVDGIAQHVFQRCHHAFEHGAVHLALGVADDELHLFAQLTGHLSDDAPQARHQAVEGHHAGAHQAFLQLGVHPCLLQQQGLGVAVARGQGFLEVEKVGSGFEERPRELLQLRVAVHFQRIEVLVAGALGFGLVAAEDLRLGFDVEAAQLVAHPLDGGFHLGEGEAEVADLLLDPATEDGGLAGQVDQAFQQLGRHLDQLLRGTPCSGLLGGFLGAADEGQLALFADHQGLHARSQDRAAQLQRFRLARRAGRQVLGEALVQLLTQFVQFGLQAFVAGLHIEEQAFRPGRTLLLGLDQVLLQVVGQVAQAFLPGQPRTTLEGVQHAQQIVDMGDFLALLLPATDGGLHRLQQVVGFLQEDIEDVRLGDGVQAIPGSRLQVHAAGRAQLFVGIGAPALDGLDQRLAVRQGAMRTHRFEHLAQAVLAGLEQAEQCRAGTQAAAAEAFVEEFQFMGEVAYGADLGHPRAALEGVQVALQGFDFEAVVRLLHPALQGGAGTVEDVETFLKEDFHQFRVLVTVEGLGHGIGSRLFGGPDGWPLGLGHIGDQLGEDFVVFLRLRIVGSVRRFAQLSAPLCLEVQRFEGFGLGQRLHHGGRQALRTALAEATDVLDQLQRIGQGTACLELLHQRGQAVMAGLQQAGKTR
ncbi:hypothetical protein D9M68_335960 [compost metagenome]